MSPHESAQQRAARLRRERQLCPWSRHLIDEALAWTAPPVEVRWPAPERRTPGEQLAADIMIQVLGRYAWSDEPPRTPPARRGRPTRRKADAA